MTSTKIKQTIKTLVSTDHFQAIGLFLVCLIVLSLIFHSSVSAFFHHEQKHKPVATKTVKKPTKQIAKAVKTTTTTTTSTVPVPTPAPTPTPTPAPKSPAPATTPTVVPSPSSNVSGLTPTSSSPPSGGSGGGSSGSSSPTITTYESTNWSGYMGTSGTFTSVSGSWIATRPTGNGSTTSADATWVGIGGVTTSDLIQVGTLNSVSASGQVTTEAFYEMLPAPVINIVSITINPGDSISASVVETSSGQFTVSITA